MNRKLDELRRMGPCVVLAEKQRNRETEKQMAENGMMQRTLRTLFRSRSLFLCFSIGCPVFVPQNSLSKEDPWLSFCRWNSCSGRWPRA